jgi:hypothetical protein
VPLAQVFGLRRVGRSRSAFVHGRRFLFPPPPVLGLPRASEGKKEAGEELLDVSKGPRP